jgi:FkbM family methyltransferase
MNMLRSLNFIARHPLNRAEPLRAIGRFLAWQLATRLLPHAVAVPFVDHTRLLVRRGMTGATGNVYCGLHEFEDMGFVLHTLRPEDLFVDVGANVGTYTVLAAGAVGCRCMAFEPVRSTFEALLANVRLNDLASRVEARNEGVGHERGTVAFTTDLDTINHVAVEADRDRSRAITSVPVTTLDAALRGEAPTVVKIDVEGFEAHVLAGADSTLRRSGVLALLLELNGSGTRYGFDEDELHAKVLQYGFVPARYEPLSRKLSAVDSDRNPAGNTLYVRNIEALQARVASAPRFAVRDLKL